MLVVSSIIGTLIGYTGWSCRSLVSATSFTLIGVINKFLTILLNVFIWDKHATPLGILSLIVSLIGGSCYQQAPMRSTDKPLGIDQPSKEDQQSAIEILPLIGGKTLDESSSGNNTNTASA